MNAEDLLARQLFDETHVRWTRAEKSAWAIAGLQAAEMINAAAGDAAKIAAAVHFAMAHVRSGKRSVLEEAEKHVAIAYATLGKPLGEVRRVEAIKPSPRATIRFSRFLAEARN